LKGNVQRKGAKARRAQRFNIGVYPAVSRSIDYRAQMSIHSGMQ
jgi:hypothetical protein